MFYMRYKQKTVPLMKTLLMRGRRHLDAHLALATASIVRQSSHYKNPLSNIENYWNQTNILYPILQKNVASDSYVCTLEDEPF